MKLYEVIRSYTELHGEDTELHGGKTLTLQPHLNLIFSNKITSVAGI